MELTLFGMKTALKQLKFAILGGKNQFSIFDSLLSLKYFKMKNLMQISWNSLFGMKTSSKQLELAILGGKNQFSILDSFLSLKYLKRKDLQQISWNLLFWYEKGLITAEISDFKW